MPVYYHHVGLEGAEEDFPKTIFNSVRIRTVLSAVPKDHTRRSFMREELPRRFKGGTCNCWGVPAGADYIIEGLQRGDHVLLVHKSGRGGFIPAFCQVRAYWYTRLPEVSNALWGSPRYPFIFFFCTERLAYSWPQFLSDVGYGRRINPRGAFLRIRPEHFSRFGGEEGYISRLRSQYAE